jgi:hypothetical protein
MSEWAEADDGEGDVTFGRLAAEEMLHVSANLIDFT